MSLLEIKDPYCNEENPIVVDFDEVTSAAYRIKSAIRRTDCTKSEHLTNLTGMEIYLKKECLQPSGCFKERGARNALLCLSPEMQERGIVAASAGNHALACCYHGLQLGIPITVFMPLNAPIMKIEKCKRYKGNVILSGKDLQESKYNAQKYALDNGMMYLNGYDHRNVLAGQGTIGLEMWEQVPDLDAVIVPVGGGGLISGISVAIKSLDKKILVYGVEPERAACFTKALEAGRPVNINLESTLADGLAVAKIGINSFATSRNLVDKVALVEESYIALAILKLIEYEKIVVEGAGAAPLASILSGKVNELKGKKVCLVLSGGNIDTTVLGRVIDRGMAAEGRLVKIKVAILDRPGGVEELCNLIGRLGVTIKDITHERAWVTSDIFMVEVKIVCETRDFEHSIYLRDTVAEKYGKIVFNAAPYPSDGTDHRTSLFPNTNLPLTLTQPDEKTVASRMEELSQTIHEQSIGTAQQTEGFTAVSSKASQIPNNAVAPSIKTSNAGTASMRPSNAIEASIKTSNAGTASIRPSSAVEASIKTSNAGTASIRPSNAIEASIKTSNAGTASIRPSSAVEASIKTSNAGTASIRPSNAVEASIKASNAGTASIRPSNAVEASIRASNAVTASIRASEVTNQTQTLATQPSIKGSKLYRQMSEPNADQVRFVSCQCKKKTGL